jgi:hypothetical protein
VKTTIAGILAAIGILMAGGSALLDNDPSTSMNSKNMLEALGTLLAATGLAGHGWFSKDKDE